MLMMVDNRSFIQSDFATSPSFVPSTPLNVVTVTSTNVISNTTQSFLLPQIETTLLPHTFSPSPPSKDISDSSLPSTLHMTNEDAVTMYQNLIEGAQVVTEQNK
jgi:hypothetical protein